MDSENDTSKQLAKNPGCGSSTLLPACFCDNPFCVGDIWHEWGCCSSANELAAAMDFDHVDDDLMDGCGFDGNVLVPANKVGDIAECRFAQPKSEIEIDKAHKESIPKKTSEDTAYCVRLWDTWAESRSQNTGVQVTPLALLDAQQLQYWLCRFIHVARKKNGMEYTPNTLYYLVCGIMCHI